MRDSAWYNKLWQTKMQELPLEGDEHAMWQNMQGLLDENMPVSSPVVPPKPAASLLKRLLYVAAAIITAAVIYYAVSHILADRHEKTNKPDGKHALINTDSATNSSHSTIARLNDEKLKTNADNKAANNRAVDKKNEAASSGITDVSPATPTSKSTVGVANKGDAKHIGNNSSGTKMTLLVPNNNVPAATHSALTGNHPYASHDTKLNSNTSSSINKTTSVNNHTSGAKYTAVNNTNAHNNKLSGHSTPGNRHSILTNSVSHTSQLQSQRTGYHANHSPNSSPPNKTDIQTNNDQRLLARQTTSAQNNINLIGNGGTTNGSNTNNTAQNTNPAVNSTSKADSTSTAKNNAAKQTADAKDKNQPDKSATKNKSTASKKLDNSKFVLDVKLGANTNTGSSINPFLGISANYNFSKKWGVAVGINAPYTRTIAGSYSKSNLTYVTVGDSNKQITHNSGKIMISSTRKIKYVDIPVLATYKVSDRFTVTAGPVISIPIKANASKNTLGALSSSADTTTLKEVTSYVNSTTINSKINFSVSAGAGYTMKRFYFDAGYLQGISPYTVSSGLGSGKIYYHTVQIGIGYQLFKSKSK
jgi:hypothetical protein